MIALDAEVTWVSAPAVTMQALVLWKSSQRSQKFSKAIVLSKLLGNTFSVTILFKGR